MPRPRHTRTVADRVAAQQDVLRALHGLLQALSRNDERAAVIRQRAGQLRESLERGLALPEVVQAEDRPLVVESVTEMMRELQDAGLELRRSEARALREHGLTTEQIARLFGVTRQRVSALLRPPDRAVSPDGRRSDR